MYQQQIASLSTLSSNTSAAAAAGLMGYNPYMMAAAASPFGGLAGFGALGGGLPGVNPADYQAAASAMASGFPAMAGKLNHPDNHLPPLIFSGSVYANNSTTNHCR